MAAPKKGAISRQILIKDSRGVMPELKITSFWSNIGDTNLGQINMKKFQGPLYTSRPFRFSKKMIESGIVNAAGFLPTIQCNELIVECVRHYVADTRTIVAPNGRVLAYLSKIAINEAFHILDHKSIVYKRKEGAQSIYDDDTDRCPDIINKYWVLKEDTANQRYLAGCTKLISRKSLMI